jgi:drug/metabolite transporter (DMT)-like permease
MLATVLAFVTLANMKLTDAQAFNFTTPLFLTMFGAVLLGERVGWRRWTAVAVGFGGVLVIAQPGSGALHWAAGVAILMAATNAVSLIVTRVLSRYDSVFSMAVYGTLVGVVCLCLPLPFVWVWPDASGWAWLIFIGAGGGLGHYFLAAAFANASASTLAPFLYLQIVWAAISGYVFINEVPGLTTLIGIAIIVASGIYIFMRERKQQRTAA